MPIGTVPPVPAHPDEEPLVCIPVNRDWIPLLIGILKPARYPEYWSGTLEESRQARRDTENLIYQLMQAEECGEMVTVNCGCCDDSGRSGTTIQIRITIDNTVEVSTDGGGTWQPSPLDPRHAVPIIESPPFSLSPQELCDLAANGVKRLQKVKIGVDTAYDQLNTVYDFALQILSVILEAVLVFFSLAELGAIIAIIYSWAEKFVDVSKENFDAAFDQTVWDAMLCVIRCYIGQNGRFTTAEFNRLIGALPGKIPDLHEDGLAVASLTQWLQIWQAEGLNVAMATGSLKNADCSDCDPCDTCAVEHWSIRHPETGYFGEITAISTDEGWIEVQSTGVNTNGGYYIYLETDDIVEGCCTLTDIVPLSPETEPTPYIWPCGTGIDDNNLQFLFDPQHNQPFAALQLLHSVPFACRLYFGKV